MKKKLSLNVSNAIMKRELVRILKEIARNEGIDFLRNEDIWSKYGLDNFSTKEIEEAIENLTL